MHVYPYELIRAPSHEARRPGRAIFHDDLEAIAATLGNSANDAQHIAMVHAVVSTPTMGVVIFAADYENVVLAKLGLGAECSREPLDESGDDDGAGNEAGWHNVQGGHGAFVTE